MSMNFTYGMKVGKKHEKRVQEKLKQNTEKTESAYARMKGR